MRCRTRRTGRRASLRPDLDDHAVDHSQRTWPSRFIPTSSYGAYDVDGKAVIVAKDLAAAVAKKIGRPFDRLLATFDGKAMERLVFRHPLYARDSLGVLGDYVTLEAGTGAVHTAPGHGADDYHTGVRYGLEIYAPLDAGGHYNESVELFGGCRCWTRTRRSKRR